jgi:hypothetical protein
MPPDQNTLDAAADKVKPMLTTTYADWYTGVALQQPDGPGSSVQSALMIYRIPHPALDAAVRAALPGLTLIFVDAPYNAANIQQLQDRIASLMEPGKTKGFTINGVSCDFSGVCTIGVDNLDKATGPLAAEFGTARIKIVQQAADTPA